LVCEVQLGKVRVLMEELGLERRGSDALDRNPASWISKYRRICETGRVM
jgi:hypothetical protein